MPRPTKRVKVPLYGNINRATWVQENSTVGATIGTDLYYADGTVVTLANLRARLEQAASNAAGAGGGGPLPLARTLWSLIGEIPANIVALAALNTVGLAVRQTAGTWVTRAIGVADVSRLTIADGDGDAGAPTLDMADISALSVWGNATNATAKPAPIVASSDVTVLQRAGTSLVFATVPDGALSSNVVLKNAYNVFTGAGGGATPAIELANTVPTIVFNEASAAANNRLWPIYVASALMSFSTMDDARSSALTWMRVARSGNLATSISLIAASMRLVTSTTINFVLLDESPNVVVERSLKIVRLTDANLGFFAYNASFASPTYPSIGQTLGEIRWYGYDQNTAQFVQSAGVMAVAATTWTSTARGTALTFSTTPQASITKSEVARFVPSGALQVTGTFGTGFLATAGIELGMSGGVGYLQAYNRNFSAYLGITLAGSSIVVQINGVAAHAFLDGEIRIYKDTGFLAVYNDAGTVRSGYLQIIAAGSGGSVNLVNEVGLPTNLVTTAAGFVSVGQGGNASTFAATNRATLVLNGVSETLIEFRNAAVAVGYIYMASGANAQIYCAAGSGFAIYTNATLYVTLSTAGALRLHAYGAGTLTTDASGNVTAVSDERIKRNVRPFVRGLAEICRISPITFGYTPESGLELAHRYAGFSAQDVEKAIPEAIGWSGKYRSLQDRALIGALVNAVKELKAELDALR